VGAGEGRGRRQVNRQPWCDGNIGMFGYSYVGFTQVRRPDTAGSGHYYCITLLPQIVAS
jgi:hypothetical protein